MIPIVVYTHTDYSDIWPLFIERQRRFFDGHIIAVCNEPASFADSTVAYNDSLCYRDRLASTIQQLPPVFLFLHEDFILYDKPNRELMQEYYSMVASGDADVIRLMRSGELELNPTVIKGRILHRINPNKSKNQFAIQASIFHGETLERLLATSTGKSIWELEADLQRSAAQKADTFYHWLYEPARGGHYDSIAYPCTATAVVKGKWNSEYRHELKSKTTETSTRDWT